MPNPNRFGVAVVGTGCIVRLVEKAKQPISVLALVGVYRFTPKVFDVFSGLEPSWRGELAITEAIQRLVDKGRSVDFRVVVG